MGATLSALILCLGQVEAKAVDIKDLSFKPGTVFVLDSESEHTEWIIIEPFDLSYTIRGSEMIATLRNAGQVEVAAVAIDFEKKTTRQIRFMVEIFDADSPPTARPDVAREGARPRRVAPARDSGLWGLADLAEQQARQLSDLGKVYVSAVADNYSMTAGQIEAGVLQTSGHAQARLRVRNQTSIKREHRVEIEPLFVAITEALLPYADDLKDVKKFGEVCKTISIGLRRLKQ